MKKKFNLQLDIGTRILLTSIIIVLVFSGLNIYTYLTINSMQAKYHKLITETTPIINSVSSMQTEIWTQNAEVRAYILSGSPSYKQNYQDSRKRLAQLFDHVQKSADSDTKQKVLQLRSAVSRFEKTLEIGMAIRNVSNINETIKFLNASNEQINAAIQEAAKFNSQISAQVNQQVADTAADIERMKRTALILNILILLLAAGSSYRFARQISQPLKTVAGAAQSIAAGDLRQKSINYSRADEIGHMAQAVNIMIKNLRQIINQVAKASEQIAASSEQLSATTHHSAGLSVQVVDTVTEVAAGSAAQVQAVEDTSSTITNMVHSITQIAENAGHVSTKSQDASQMAKDGEIAVDEAMRQMQTISQSVSRSSAVVGNLGASSRQISEIIGVISDIAGQTNLLALNAAIEAARAGEHGRGFAVVADEVRKLAEQSHAAAQKISAIITEVQKETDIAVSTMQEGTAEAAQGIDVISQTGIKFKKIVTVVGELNQQIHRISTAAEQLASSGGQIVAAVENVKHIAVQTAANTQTISTSAGEQAASMQEINTASQSLATMAEGLQNLVDQFEL
ncbi:chemotaxis methyl-accepting receptor [Lucifera butyrica]|uniref:Chemotaxis methyl-accepting receptor n=1 Tax=Lucifera butyrica TaxID=1351585 RepID=A0A498R6N2_9FIRM|nr:methyl-accepting chemotaxis protein [Lucifera butyrica]VBB07011.1 chemotaxis methyl-accepting receptor [Lucifera butyrica]